MPTFSTPDPIALTLELAAGTVRIAAGDRTDTVVEVRPSDESDESDVQAAARVGIEHADGAVRIRGPKARTFDFSRATRSVDVSVELPTGSSVVVELQVGDVRATGRLGRCRLSTAAGDVRLDRTGPLHVSTSAGHVSADAVAGDAEISTASGRVEVGAVEGRAAVKNSNGDTSIGSVTGDVRVRAANGSIRVGRAGAGVDAKTSNGSIRLAEVARGAITLGTAMGDLDVGIAEGTAAWLAVTTGFGRVHNLLEAAARPAETDETVEVTGRTSYGDITIHRS